MILPDDDDNVPEGYLANEAVCPCHRLTYNRHLGACPIAAADAPTPWSPK